MLVNEFFIKNSRELPAGRLCKDQNPKKMWDFLVNMGVLAEIISLGAHVVDMHEQGCIYI